METTKELHEEEMQVNEASSAYAKNEYYTYADYVTWDDDQRWELIDGKPYLMSAPTFNHQSILGEIFRQLASFLKGKKCKALFAPFDVRLNHDTLDDTVVQPDVLVICDRSKLSDGKALRGAPDLAVEVLSPSNPKHDTLLKYKKYMESGVQEYWVVDPTLKSVHVHILRDGKYYSEHYSDMDSVPVYVLEGCVVELRDVFDEMI
jgi:Uma2 family endonuclease